MSTPSTTFRTLTAAALLALAAAHARAGDAAKPPKPPPLDSKARSALKDAIRDLFEAADDTARAEAFKILEEAPPIPKSAEADFRRWAFRCAMQGTRLELKHETTFETSQGTGTLRVSGAKSGRTQPLLIGLHGGGAGTGDGATSEQKWQEAVGRGCLCVFPTVLQKDDSAWNTEREERYVLEILEAVKRTCRVDTNRVYLVGHSMGGFGTWSIGGHFADLFAAISPNAGGVFLVVGGAEPKPAPGVLPNLHNTPVYFFHSTDDAQVGPLADQTAAKCLAALRSEHPGGYEHVYQEYSDIGHGMPPKGVGPILDYILAFPRDPYPPKVVFEPFRSYKRFFAWVEVPSGSGVRRIAAAYDRKSNRIDVTTEGAARGFSLYLCPGKMVDPGKEVGVTVNGEEAFKGFVEYSVAALARSIHEFRDPARIFSMRIDIR